MRKQKIINQLKTGAAPVILGLAMVSAPAYAQDISGDTAAEESTEGNTIVVTGSRIQRTDVDAPSPVQVFDSETISARGSGSLQEFLFSSNVAGPGIFSEAATLSQSAGSSFFDSRGFGTGYTLVLLNGRRLPATPITGQQATDLNQLPIAAVDRVEYLSDGASAVYGSDAISGVINIITKRDFDGLSLSGRVGISDEGDGQQYRMSGVFGTTSDRGSALLTAEVFHQSPVRATSRPLIRSANGPAELGGEDGRSPTGFPGTWINGAQTVAEPFPGCAPENVRPASFADSGTECAYDFAPLYQVFPESTRFAASAFAEYDVTDNLNVYADTRYSRSKTLVRNGASPAFFAVPAGVQGNPYEGTSFALRRIVDGGPRARDATNQTFAVAVGFDWNFSGDHHLTGYYQKSWVDQLQLGISGQNSREALEAAVADGTFRLDSINSQEVVDSISVTTFRNGNLEEEIFNLGMNGLIDLGGIDLGYAIGAEARDEFYADKADELTISGDILGGAASNGEGDRQAKAVYGELSFSPFDMLELSVAGRYDDIDAAGADLGEEFTYKVAGSLTPTDWLLARASYGTGFKAPSLGELFLGRSFGVTRAIDTKVCDAARGTANEDAECRTREIRSISGGNPSLRPETSKALSAGVVLTPGNDLRFSADYWNIKVKDKIGALGVQEILNNENLYPELVNRIGGRLSNPDSFVASNLQNLTREEGEGIDYVLTFTPALNDTTDLIFDLRVSQLLSFKRQSSAIQPLCEDRGTTSEPRWRGNGRLGFTSGGFSGNLTGRYVGKTEDDPAGRANGLCSSNDATQKRDVEDYIEFGLNMSYAVNEVMTAKLGVNNLFDVSPPASEVAAGGWPWYDQALYTNMGRFFYVEVGLDF